MIVLSNVKIVWWTLARDEAPTVAGARELMALHGLNPERLADISTETAFTRACAALETDSLRVCFFKRQLDGRKVAQFDTLQEIDGDLRRLRQAHYALTKDGALELLKYGGLPDLPAAFARAKVTCIWNDVSRAIQSVLTQDGLGVYALRKTGAPYVVPLSAATEGLIGKLTGFAESLGCRFLYAPVPDLQAQRDEIADVVAASYAADLDAHDAAIAAYSELTTSNVVQNRHAALSVTENMLQGVRGLLNGHFDALTQRIAACRAALGGVQQKIAAKAAAVAQQGRLKGTRRIAGLAPAPQQAEAPAPQTIAAPAPTQQTLFGVAG